MFARGQANKTSGTGAEEIPGKIRRFNGAKFENKRGFAFCPQLQRYLFKSSKLTQLT